MKERSESLLSTRIDSRRPSAFIETRRASTLLGGDSMRQSLLIDGRRQSMHVGFLMGSLMPGDIDDKAEESLSVLRSLETPKPSGRRESRAALQHEMAKRRCSKSRTTPMVRRKSSHLLGKRLSLFEPPVLSLSTLSNPPSVPHEIAALWQLIDVHAKGYLNFEEVEYLLDDLGVVMDDWKETEFFHMVDSNHDGRVSLEEFHTAYKNFKENKKFLYSFSEVHLACNIAARQGITDTSMVVRMWHKYDVNNDECLDQNEVGRLLADLKIDASEERIAEFMAEMDVDSSGFIEFREFVELFSLESIYYGTHDQPQDGLDDILGEIRKVRAGVDFHTNNNLFTKEQQAADALKRLKDWYDTYYVWLLFLYAQVNILIPTFLLFIDALSFDRSYTYITPYLLVTDVLYLWWVYKKLVLPRPNDLGVLLTNPSEIRRHYLFSWEFATDLIIAVPLDLLIGAAFPSGLFHPLFRVNKLVLLLHLNDMFYKCLASLLGPRWWRIANALYWWGILAHFVACLFLLIAREEGDDGTRVVLTVANFSQLSAPHRYLQAFSYAVNTMAGLSRGTIPPGDLQQAFALFTCLLGVWVYALMLAVVALALGAVTQKSRFAEYLDNAKDVLRGEVSAGRLTDEFVEEALMYHRHVFATTGLLSLDENLIEEVPLQLDVALSLVRGRGTICKVPIFQGTCDDDEYVYALERSLKSRIVPPQYEIIKEGEVGTEMFFITHGKCDVLVKGQAVHVLEAGSFFGEIALMASCPRTATIRASTFCNLLVLDKDSFNAVMELFPEPMHLIENRARDRIRVMMQLEKEGRSKRVTDLGRGAVACALAGVGAGGECVFVESEDEGSETSMVKEGGGEFEWLASRPSGSGEGFKEGSTNSPSNPLRSRRRLNRSDTGSATIQPRRPLAQSLSFSGVKKVDSFVVKTAQASITQSPNTITTSGGTLAPLPSSPSSPHPPHRLESFPFPTLPQPTADRDLFAFTRTTVVDPEGNVRYQQGEIYPP